ncbi:MAG TPA: Gfo/Idh/MocA family oxidoreductase [Planctomycetota bacterium]|nr:Gfo/Idh/MocA family oxidoreductase [Planctomycetota bacterium]
MARYAKAADIKVGVVGYGGAFNMGRQHLNEMKKAGMTPTAVVEIDQARLDVAKTDFPGIETYQKVDQCLASSKVDLLVLITPHNTHAPLALQILEAGKHVVCEKPFAVTTAECDAMIALAQKKSLMVSTYHNRHWDSWILNAVKMIKGDGVIGEISRIEAHMGGYGKPGDWWRTSKSISGGILYDWGVHLLEYCLQLIDSDIVEVSGYAKKGFWGPQTKFKDDANEDEGKAVVRFASGQWIDLTITSLDANPKRGMLEITGTKGTFVIDWNNYELITPGENGVTRIQRGPHGESQGHKLYENVANHLVNGEKLVITPEWARRPIHVLDLADQSAKAGRAMAATYR